MKTASLFIVVLFGSGFLFCRARELPTYGRYQPLHSHQSVLNRDGQAGYHPIKASDRVNLPGLRPNSAELLQRTLAQRYSRSLGKSPEAISRKAVPKIFSDSPSFARARGIYAELRFVQMHPHIGLVGARNASQNDAYSRPVDRKAPIGYQIKTRSGGPTAYASAMISDHPGLRTIWTDDH